MFRDNLKEQIEYKGMIIKCHNCHKDINTYQDGYIIDEKSGEPICLECYKNSLLSLNK